MIKAKPINKKLVIELLAKSFQDNQSVNYTVLQDKNTLNRIHALMDYSFQICCSWGDAFLSDDLKACALLLYPHKKRTSLKSIWLDLQLVLKAIGLKRMFKILKKESLVKSKQTKHNFAYLWFIGVDPMYQNLGIGSQLLKEVVAEAEKQNLPVLVETSTLKNIPWYEKFGFSVYAQLELGYTLYFMKHEPIK